MTSVLRIVLGASDPEIARIRAIAEAAGLFVVQATAPGRDGNPAPVGGATTYKATWPSPEVGDVWVETAPANGGKAAIAAADATLVDHHEIGDPGYGRAPTEALEASSLGQVLALLGIVPSDEDLVVAACDHCLTAAYAGLVPGVSREAVLSSRVASAAKFERRSADELETEIESALRALETASAIEIGGVPVADLRSFAPPAEADPKSDRGGVAGLHHAGPMTGRAYVARIREKTGREKVVLGGDGPGTTTNGKAAAGFAEWAKAHGLIDAYGGDPARGFAGAYVPEIPDYWQQGGDEDFLSYNPADGPIGDRKKI